MSAEIRGVEARMLVDTGATDTVLSADLYYKMVPEGRPTLVKEGIKLHRADGSAI